jgi:putative RNA 2'-phosphotransferase
MTKINPKQVSKRISRVLRHEPWLYELELDASGWTSLDILIDRMRPDRPNWNELSREHIHELIRTAAKERFEIKGDMIRAIYGHSLSGFIQHEAKTPPETLYHGTSPDLVNVIMIEGLQPMSRQYVHLSADVETAKEVGRRKASKPVLLKVKALEAAHAGHVFHQGNDKVWLSKVIPPEFIDL